MPIFRRKPRYVNAWQWDGTRTQRGVCTCETNSVPHLHTMHENGDGSYQHVFLSKGDWIIEELDGIHYYPCQSTVFYSLYEAV